MSRKTDKRPVGETLHPVSDWAGTILVLLFATTAIAQPFVVPTASMDKTLMIGDHLIVDKMIFSPSGGVSKYLLPFQEVRRGDIIVFKYPLNVEEAYVKRCIGVPGDRIRLADKKLFVNGQAVDEPYIQLDPTQNSDYLNNFPQRTPDIMIYPRGRDMLRNHVVNGELVVPPGFYFAMGDNRDNSADSRFWGLVPRDNIMGTPVLIWWSYDAPTERLQDRNINPGHLLDIVLNFFSKTRWDRQFKVLKHYKLEPDTRS